MHYDTKNILRASLIPVLLGDSASAHALAAKIYLRSGVISYVCDSKPKIWDFIDPFSRFFTLISDTENAVICEALAYLSNDKDYIPIIVPCNDAFSAFVEKNRDFLEKRFIISNRDDFFKKHPASLF